MSLQTQDISRAANSLVAEFGEEAEAENARYVVDCTRKGCIVTAGIWKEVGSAIAQIRANKVTETRFVGRERSNDPSS